MKFWNKIISMFKTSYNLGRAQPPKPLPTRDEYEARYTGPCIISGQGQLSKQQMRDKFGPPKTRS